MTFKKDGTDPITTRWPLDGLSNGLRFIGEAFRALGIGVAHERQPEDEFRYRPSRRRAPKPKRRRNMLHVSKRVRRKHRRERKAA